MIREREPVANQTRRGASQRRSGVATGLRASIVGGFANLRRLSRRTKIAIATLLIAVLVILGFLRMTAVSVEVVSPKRGDAADVVYATGIIEPLNWAKIASLERKRIIEICKCEGKAVKQGDVLVRLDDDEEKAQLQQLEARLQRLRSDAERIGRLVDRDITSRVTYDEILTQIDEHKARIAAQLDRINDLELKAPIDGVVLRRDGEVGEIAGTGQNETLLWVGQPTPLQVVAEINEDDIGQVKVGQPVLLRHESHLDTALRAEVDRITPQGDPVTKTFRAYLALPDDTPLMVGMSVEANVIVRETKDALLLPAEAVFDDTVQVVSGGRFEERKITTGVRGAYIEVVDGLTDEALVISPFRKDLGREGRVRYTAPSL